MTGELNARQVWRDMVRDMPKGEPAEGDQGLDHTHTWGRTYWGGAMFCLVADVEIRRQTGNRKGLQDALRAMVAQGGTIDHEWPLDKALAIGDQATGTHVLTEQYAKWKDAPVTVDLQQAVGGTRHPPQWRRDRVCFRCAACEDSRGDCAFISVERLKQILAVARRAPS